MKKINNFIKDTFGAFRVRDKRRKIIKNGDPKKEFSDPIRKLTEEVHPESTEVKVINIEDASITSKTFTFKGINGSVLPPFLAGQYVSFDLTIGNTITTRPFSISSAPFEARLKENPFFQITVRKGRNDGFVSNYFYNDVKVGDKFTCHLPLGQFHYDPLRDSKNVVCIAGGSGITPFYSMAKEVEHGSLNLNLTILYGSVTTSDMPLFDKLSEIKSDKVKVIPVISGEGNYTGEKGYITKDIIQKYSLEDSTYFICGPQVMYEFIKNELNSLNIPERRIRMEVFGSARNVEKLEDYPLSNVKTFKLSVYRGIDKTVIDAKSNESIAVALERAGIKNPTRCRSGACGFCRCKLISGNVYIPKVGDGRRYGDKKYGYIHACSTFPLSDCEIKINIIE